MTIKMTMGEKLKDLRTEKGLTTKEICLETGISEAVYNGLENDMGRDTGYSRITRLLSFMTFRLIIFLDLLKVVLLKILN